MAFHFHTVKMPPPKTPPYICRIYILPQSFRAVKDSLDLYAFSQRKGMRPALHRTHFLLFLSNLSGSLSQSFRSYKISPSGAFRLPRRLRRGRRRGRNGNIARLIVRRNGAVRRNRNDEGIHDAGNFQRHRAVRGNRDGILRTGLAVVQIEGRLAALLGADRQTRAASPRCPSASFLPRTQTRNNPNPPPKRRRYSSRPRGSARRLSA